VEFEQMGRLEQTLHALEYQIRVLEFRISANGWLRAWILTSLKILLFVLVPVAAFLIALSFLVPAAAGVSSFLHYTELAAQSALWTVIYGVLTMIGLALGVGLFAVLLRLRRPQVR
jgi:di/tricarboxylate transporter